MKVAFRRNCGTGLLRKEKIEECSCVPQKLQNDVSRKKDKGERLDLMLLTSGVPQKLRNEGALKKTWR